MIYGWEGLPSFSHQLLALQLLLLLQLWYQRKAVNSTGMEVIKPTTDFQIGNPSNVMTSCGYEAANEPVAIPTKWKDSKPICNGQ
jgi:hypothetical protein